jgi:MFS family permease
MARLADTLGRARVLGSVLAIWSVMTVLTGRTVNFATMLMARAGVGVGEAGGLPATHALIADYFSPRLRGKALSAIGICGSLGLSLALFGGGRINDWLGWRAAFYIGGLPGLALAALVLFTIREPKVAGGGGSGPGRVKTDLKAVFATLWGRRSYVLLSAGLGIAAIGSYGQSVWTPAFLMRTYHLSAGSVGTSYSAVVLPASLISIFLGGAINDWLLKRDQRWPLWILTFSFALTVPLSLVFFLIHDFPVAMAIALVSTIIGGLWIGPSYALVQALAGPRLRAISAAIFMMIVNIVGLGLGPYVTGALSDALALRLGERALAISLCVVTMTCLIGAAFFLAATRTIAADVAQANADGDPGAPKSA